MRADGAGADPDDLARGAQRVEVGRLVLGQAGGEDVALERRGDQRRALQLAETSTSASSPRRPAPDAVPAGQEAGQGAGVDRLHLAAQRGQRAAAQLAQDVVVAPLALDAVGPELAPHDAGPRPISASSAARTASTPTP